MPYDGVMKAEVRKAEPLKGDDEGSTLYRKLLETRPRFSSPEEARHAYTRELQSIADAHKMSVQAVFLSAENSRQRTDEQRRIMKLASWIAAIA